MALLIRPPPGSQCLGPIGWSQFSEEVANASRHLVSGAFGTLGDLSSHSKAASSKKNIRSWSLFWWKGGKEKEAIKLENKIFGQKLQRDAATNPSSISSPAPLLAISSSITSDVPHAAVAGNSETAGRGMASVGSAAARPCSLESSGVGAGGSMKADNAERDRGRVAAAPLPVGSISSFQTSMENRQQLAMSDGDDQQRCLETGSSWDALLEEYGESDIAVEALALEAEREIESLVQLKEQLWESRRRWREARAQQMDAERQWRSQKAALSASMNALRKEASTLRVLVRSWLSEMEAADSFMQGNSFSYSQPAVPLQVPQHTPLAMPAAVAAAMAGKGIRRAAITSSGPVAHWQASSTSAASTTSASRASSPLPALALALNSSDHAPQRSQPPQATGLGKSSFVPLETNETARADNLWNRLARRMKQKWSWEEWCVGLGLAAAFMGGLLLLARLLVAPAMAAAVHALPRPPAAVSVTAPAATHTSGRWKVWRNRGEVPVSDVKAPPYQYREARPGVMDLTQNDFHAAIRRRPTFVMFYAPWCPYCRQLEATWKLLPEELAEKNFNVQVVRVDADKFPSFTEDYQLPGFPTLMLFNGPTPVAVHRGPRDLASLLSFVDQSLP
eukprot:TRINITY_DN3648_c0_g1_i2.p1 TRINITY_DN3648_c0_g1~~TRINITY_DN3648_c0_g1_i2.p1  ORF type:complete len:621 (-),score=138.56 TRINITY_DN3648_c0_g1_i2:134-1996(-)